MRQWVVTPTQNKRLPCGGNFHVSQITYPAEPLAETPRLRSARRRALVDSGMGKQNDALMAVLPRSRIAHPDAIQSCSHALHVAHAGGCSLCGHSASRLKPIWVIETRARKALDAGVFPFFRSPLHGKTASDARENTFLQENTSERGNVLLRV